LLELGLGLGLGLGLDQGQGLGLELELELALLKGCDLSSGEKEKGEGPFQDCNCLGVAGMFGCTPKTFGRKFPWGREKPWNFTVTQTGTARAHDCLGE